MRDIFDKDLILNDPSNMFYIEIGNINRNMMLITNRLCDDKALDRKERKYLTIRYHILSKKLRSITNEMGIGANNE